MLATHRLCNTHICIRYIYECFYVDTSARWQLWHTKYQQQRSCHSDRRQVCSIAYEGNNNTHTHRCIHTFVEVGDISLICVSICCGGISVHLHVCDLSHFGHLLPSTPFTTTTTSVLLFLELDFRFGFLACHNRLVIALKIVTKCCNNFTTPQTHQLAYQCTQCIS